MSLTFEPKMRGNVQMGVNPIGLKREILNEIDYVKAQGTFEAPKKVLILGASSSYGLATRISLAFGGGADTIGVSYEKGPRSERNLGTPGWYNNIYFKQEAEKEGHIAKNFVGDAFSDEMKKDVIQYIRDEFGGTVDLVVYSLATGKRIDAETGEVYTSAIKTIGEPIEGYDINLQTEEFYVRELEGATEEEIESTRKVMGGEDWLDWINVLHDAKVLAQGAKTVIYSYLGSNLNYDYYQGGTLGVAKADCDVKAKEINTLLKDINGQAIVAVCTAVTTKASAVIPYFPVYCIGLYKVMEKHGLHETPIMHQDRIYRDMIYGDKAEWDEEGRLRPDRWELDPEIQQETETLIRQINADNFKSELTAYDTLTKEFHNLNGFEVDGYQEEEVTIEDLKALEP